MANVSLNSTLYHSMSPFNITLLVFYFIIVLVGLTGNALVTFIVYKTKSMHTTTNFLLASLAVADFLSLLFCPIPLIVSLFGQHVGGPKADFVCKFFTGYTVSNTTAGSSFFFLVVLAVERYHAVMKPLNSELRFNKRTVTYAIIFIWVCCILFSSPGFFFSEYDEQLARCLDPWTIEKAPSMKAFFLVTIVGAGIFSSVMFVCYFQILKGIFVSKTVCSTKALATATQADVKVKKKLTLICFSVSFAFLLCYPPFLIFELYLAYRDKLDPLSNYETLYIIYRITQFILHANSCMNPFFYGFQSSNYRENFKALLFCKTFHGSTCSLTV